MFLHLLALLPSTVDLPPANPSPPSPQPGVEALQYPATELGTMAAFHDAKLGDVDRDGGVDAIVLDGQRILTLLWVEARTTSSVLTDSSGVDVLANGMDLDTETQGDARLAVVGPSGLQTFVWSDSSGGFEVSDDSLPALINAATVEWVDWDLDGDLELFVLEAGRWSAVVLDDAGQSVWTTLESFTFSVPVTQALPIDYLPNGDLELAVAYASGLSIYESGAPAPFYSRGSSVGAGLLARARGLAATDRLVWLTGPFGDDHLLVAFDHTDDAYDLLSITGELPVSIATGDRDLDGDDDLVLTLASTPDVLLVELEETAQGVFASSAERYALIEPLPTPRSDGPGNVAGARFADLDADGTVDLFVASSDAYECYIAHLPDILEAPFGHGTFEGFLPGSFSGTTDGYSGQMVGLLEATYPAEVTELEITTWHRPEAGAFTQEQALSICFQQVVPGAQQHEVTLMVPELQFIDVAQTVFYTVRPLNAEGRLAYSPSHLAYSTEPLNLDDIESADGWGDPELVTFDDDGSGGLLGVPVGGVKGTDRVSPFQPGARPKTSGASCLTPGD